MRTPLQMPVAGDRNEVSDIVGDKDGTQLPTRIKEGLVGSCVPVEFSRSLGIHPQLAEASHYGEGVVVVKDNPQWRALCCCIQRANSLSANSSAHAISRSTSTPNSA